MSIPSTEVENRKHHTQKNFECARISRELYYTVGHYSIKEDKNSIKMNGINNIPFMIKDFGIREKIISPDIYTLKGNKVRTKPKVMVNDYIDIPQELKDTHQNI